MVGIAFVAAQGDGRGTRSRENSGCDSRHACHVERLRQRLYPSDVAGVRGGLDRDLLLDLGPLGRHIYISGNGSTRIELLTIGARRAVVQIPAIKRIALIHRSRR